MRVKTSLGGLAAAIFLALVATGPVHSEDRPSFLTFESGHVRPLALSPAGDRLFAVNTPDNRLEIFTVSPQGLAPLASVAVGMEPVAVAVRSETEVWVVNHLSDSVSIVELNSPVPRVARTLLVGDEPRDLVFAGAKHDRAFITTAHRGQHRLHPSLKDVPGAGDPQLSTPGIGRADLWVFDASDLGPALGGKPLGIVTLFGDTPRALAATPDGSTVYAAVFHSGNQTTAVTAAAVCNGFQSTDLEDACPEQFPGVPGGSPGPATNHQGAPAPEVGLVVKYDQKSEEWQDELGRSWNAAVRFQLPDQDIFAIDAESLMERAAFPHVGTVLFNMAINPQSGNLYVSNTEAHNEVRFEGPGDFGGTTVQGHLAEARITVIRPQAEAGRRVEPHHLNPHIDYSVRPAPTGVKQHSLATPLEMAVTSDGKTLYVAAFGSSKIGVVSTEELEAGRFRPRQASASYVEVKGGGPTGLVLDEKARRLYVSTRFDNGVSVLDLETSQEIQHLTFHNPEPAEVVVGRPLLYDARATSSNGEASCSSCHVFGDMDGLVWDLGNPDEDVTRSPIEMTIHPAIAESLRPDINGTGDALDFHPMKGPMTTQTLRGLVHAGAMHWRGDRATGVFGTDPFDTDLSLRNFNVAFPGLVGNVSQLSAAEIQKLADFLLQVTLPPNPVRSLDNALTPVQKLGREFYVGPRRSDGASPPSDVGFTCEECHVLNAADGHFGTDGRQSFEGESQIFKIPHMRNAYQKVGMFGTPRIGRNTLADPGPTGDQVRGTGYLHDGTIDTLFRFFHGGAFRLSNDGLVGFRTEAERRGMTEFVLAFPTDLAPIVGQQITLTEPPLESVDARLELLRERARAPFLSKLLGGEVRECDLVVKGALSGEERGFYYDPDRDLFFPDRENEPPLTHAALRALALEPGQELTYTCVPPGSGLRQGVDRDGDGFFDRDELDSGTDPADAASFVRRCLPGPNQLCAGNDRFAISVQWHTSASRYGSGRVVPGTTDDSGLLWFFHPDNWEMLVKVLDGCSVNGHFWVLAAAPTNVGYTLRVRDLAGRKVRTYTNPLGHTAETVADTAAFATCETGGAPPASPGARIAPPFEALDQDSTSVLLPRAPAPESSCVAATPALCLQQGRFRIQVNWKNAAGKTGVGHAAPLRNDTSGLLWFFNADNWEMLVKVLDGCHLNDRYWVLAAAATNVEYTLEVTDTTTGQIRTYTNPLGTLSPAMADTDAFASCAAPSGLSSPDER